MTTKHNDKQTYAAPAIEVEWMGGDNFLKEVFTHGDPKGTGIVIDTEGDDSDDDNFGNSSSFWDD